MIELVITFLILAIIAGVFGFTGIEIISIQLAQICFFIFLVLFALALVNAIITRRKNLPPL